MKAGWRPNAVQTLSIRSENVLPICVTLLFERPRNYLKPRTFSTVVLSEIRNGNDPLLQTVEDMNDRKFV